MLDKENVSKKQEIRPKKERGLSFWWVVFALLLPIPGLIVSKLTKKDYPMVSEATYSGGCFSCVFYIIVGIVLISTLIAKVVMGGNA